MKFSKITKINEIFNGIYIINEVIVFDVRWYQSAYSKELKEAGIVWGKNAEVSNDKLFNHYLSQSNEQNYLACFPIDLGWYKKAYDISFNDSELSKSLQLFNVLHHYIRTGSDLQYSPAPSFDEEWYLAQYRDVFEEIFIEQTGVYLSGYHHFMLVGRLEGRYPNYYLSRNSVYDRFPWIQEEIEAGQILSILDVYETQIKMQIALDIHAHIKLDYIDLEIKDYSRSNAFAESIYLKHVSGLKEGEGQDHWLNHGLAEDQRGLRARISGYSESEYLRKNPDVAQAVAKNIFPSGYFHWLMFGHTEGRDGALQSNDYKVYDYFREALEALPSVIGGPLVSIIMPTFNTQLDHLKGAIESVRRQLYPNWELCIADDGSDDPFILEYLNKLELEDSRIKIVYLSKNQGISSASNAALNLCSGKWVALLDHDDTLAEEALVFIAQAIISNDALDVIYTDEDKVSEDGSSYYDLSLKPGWSPELLRSTMYVGHLTVYKKEVVIKAGGFRSEFDGTQDYELLLRVSRLTNSVCHISKVLYHWRAAKTSTAFSINAKPYALKRQRLALSRHIAEYGIPPQNLELIKTGRWRVKYRFSIPEPLISIVIPTAGQMGLVGKYCFSLIQNCVMSIIANNTYKNYEIVIIHNGNLSKPILYFLEGINQVRLVEYKSSKFNFSEKINLGVEHAAGEFVLLLNDDTEVISPDFLSDLVGLASFPGVGAAGAQLLYPNGRVQHSGVVMTAGGATHANIGGWSDELGSKEFLALTRNIFAVTGACLMVRKSLYIEVGGFDSSLPLNYNDVDFCLKIKKLGLRMAIDPHVRLYHFESLSKEGTFAWEAQRFAHKWGYLKDPYVNPNFNKWNPFFEIKKDSLSLSPAPDYAGIFYQNFVKRITNIAEEQIKFSFILSVFNTKKNLLLELESTIINQTYQNYEWIIVDNGSENEETISWIKDISKNRKVKLKRLEENQGIMGGYREAFLMASGEYVVPIDADDFLTLDALSIGSNAILENEYPDALYSDECKSNLKSRIFNPFFKPDWDDLLFLNICYVAHLCFIKTDSAIKVSAYSDDLATWCHDWDTFLRISRAHMRISHIPHVLYAWRINPGSTASLESSGKPDALSSHKYVLEKHLQLTKLNKKLCVVSNDLFDHPGIWRVKPRLDGLPKKFNFIIDARGISSLEGVYLESLKIKNLYPGNINVIVVCDNNQSYFDLNITPDSIEEVLTNAAAASPYVGYMRGECGLEDEEGVIESLGLLHAFDRAALISGRVLNKDNKILWGSGYFGFGGFAGCPEEGNDVADSGYHGISFCQHKIDVASNAFWISRSSIILDVLKKEGNVLKQSNLGNLLSIFAYLKGLDVLFTPFTTIRSGQKIEPLRRPSGEVLGELSCTIPLSSKYYNRNLSFSIGSAYRVEVD